MSLYEYFDMASCESNRYQLTITVQGRFIKPLQLWFAFKAMFPFWFFRFGLRAFRAAVLLCSFLKFKTSAVRFLALFALMDDSFVPLVLSG